MTKERSAGVVVYTQADGGPRRYLLLDYGKYWDFPKGHLEPGEDDRTAALRELVEETGITDVVLDERYRRAIHYYFRDKKGRLVAKDVVFFVGWVTSDAVTISDEHVGHEFLPYPDALKRLKYANAKEVLKLAETHLAEPGGTDKMTG
jgi:8-oxo-dGTP pyrophosphatase MutT (NUDIX family)